MTTNWNTQVHSGWWSGWPKTKIAHSAVSKRWGAKSRKTAPLIKFSISFIGPLYWSILWNLNETRYIQNLAIKGPVLMPTNQEPQSGRNSLHPYHTCIAVLQCDTNQEPSLEEMVSTHITLALQYCSVTQIRSPVWRRNCSAHEYQPGRNSLLPYHTCKCTLGNLGNGSKRLIRNWWPGSHSAVWNKRGIS